MTGLLTTDQYIDAISRRRSIYGLNDKSNIADDRILHIIEQIQLTTPSSYNTQPGRIVVLLGPSHKRLWHIVGDIALPIIEGNGGSSAAQAMRKRFASFEAAYGSVLFLEDESVNKRAGEAHPSGAHMFPIFSEHSDAMAQIQVWTALELEGFGANLQHIGAAIPQVEEAIKKEWSLPLSWKLRAHLNFGGIAQEYPTRPEKQALSETVKAFKL